MTQLCQMSDSLLGLPLLLLYGDQCISWVQDDGLLCGPSFSFISNTQVPRWGGHVQQALVSLHIGNDPLQLEDKSAHTHMPTSNSWEFFPEVIMAMSNLNWLNVVSINGDEKTQMEHCGLPLPRFSKYLQTWRWELSRPEKRGK